MTVMVMVQGPHFENHWGMLSKLHSRMPKIYKEGDSTSKVLFLRGFNSQCHFFLEALGRRMFKQTVGLSARLALCAK